MIFIIGGAYQGKLNYALEYFHLKHEDVADCIDSSEDEIRSKKIIYNFHLLIKRLLKDEQDISVVKEKISDILEENNSAVIISNEIGYGVVPIDKNDRQYRELTGRISCEVAKRSKQVHRVVCGIGTIIKGDIND